MHKLELVSLELMIDCYSNWEKLWKSVYVYDATPIIAHLGRFQLIPAKLLLLLSD